MHGGRRRDLYTMTAVTEDACQTKEAYLWQAKLAQEANRYDDMVRYVKLMVDTGAPLTKDDDNMFAVAYKRVLDAKRLSRRTLTSVEHKDGLTQWETVAARDYRVRIDGEQRALCDEMLSAVNTLLESGRVERANHGRTVFYLKLLADYKRYAAETIVDPDSRNSVVAESRDAYERAHQLCEHTLRPIDPVRLGLVLNYSVFLYQVCGQHEQGHDLAKRAFDEALSEIDTIDINNVYDDSTLILRLIRDNLAIWIQEINSVDPHDITVTSLQTSNNNANVSEQQE